KSALSDLNTLKPAPEKVAQWQEVCGKIRTLAIDQVEKISQDLLVTMQNGLDAIPANMQAKFQEVITALQNGEFNKYQPTQPDFQSDFKTKVPNCTTIGPWDAFSQLVGLTGASNERMEDLKKAIENQWNTIINNTAIFSALREGPYNKAHGAASDTGGHPQFFDENVSLVNIVLLFPSDLAQHIKNFSDPDERAAAIEIIDEAIQTIDDAVPPDQTTFHATLHRNDDIFQTAVS